MEVQLISYSNPDSEDCDGGNCEGFFGTCDNIFDFCLRAQGGFFCLASITTDDIEDDTLTFSTSELSILGISNPIQFNSIETEVSVPHNQRAHAHN